MITNPEIAEFKVDRPAMTFTQLAFWIILIIFNLGLLAQLLSVGLAYFLDPGWWQLHVWLVRSYGGLALILWGLTLIMTLPRPIQRLTASLPILLALQFASIHLPGSWHLAIMHPLLGFSIFYIATSLVHKVARYLFIDAGNNLASLHDLPIADRQPS